MDDRITLEEYRKRKQEFIDRFKPPIEELGLSVELKLPSEFLSKQLWHFVQEAKRIRRAFWESELPFILNPKMDDLKIMISMLEWIFEKRFDHPISGNAIAAQINDLQKVSKK
jgi:hypothetical protein